jgi:hypothetical protein
VRLCFAAAPTEFHCVLTLASACTDCCLCCALAQATSASRATRTSTGAPSTSRRR